MAGGSARRLSFAFGSALARRRREHVDAVPVGESCLDQHALIIRGALRGALQLISWISRASARATMLLMLSHLSTACLSSDRDNSHWHTIFSLSIQDTVSLLSRSTTRVFARSSFNCAAQETRLSESNAQQQRPSSALPERRLRRCHHQRTFWLAPAVVRACQKPHNSGQRCSASALFLHLIPKSSTARVKVVSWARNPPMWVLQQPLMK